MKRLILLAATAMALSACSQKAEEAAAPEAAATDAMAPAADASTAAAMTTGNGSAAGTYDIVGPDGTKGMSKLNPDGTYEDTDESGKTTAKGTWAVKDGKTCFTPEGKPEECYTEGPAGADGSFEATGADGKVTKVSPHKG